MLCKMVQFYFCWCHMIARELTYQFHIIKKIIHTKHMCFFFNIQVSEVRNKFPNFGQLFLTSDIHVFSLYTWEWFIASIFGHTGLTSDTWEVFKKCKKKYWALMARVTHTYNETSKNIIFFEDKSWGQIK